MEEREALTKTSNVQILVGGDDILHQDSNISRGSSLTSGIGSTIGDSISVMEDERTNKTKDQECQVQMYKAPDGGCWAWLVMFCSFLTNGLIFGTINTFGVIFVSLKSELSSQSLNESVLANSTSIVGDDTSNSSAKASLVGAMAIGATFALSPVSGILADKFGLRRTAFFGGLVATSGMFLSSFVVQNVGALCFTYGVMFGGGSSLCYTPSLAILGHYFNKRIGFVNGVVTAGSSLFTMIMPFVLNELLAHFGLANTLRCLSVLTSFLMLASLTFKPLMPPKTRTSQGEEETCLEKVIHMENWKNKKYVIWALAIPSALFGYFVPYVHVVQYVKEILPESDGSQIVMCIGITSGLGRLFFGKIADLPWVNRILLQQISFISIGICTMLLTVAPLLDSTISFNIMLMIALLMGLFDGCFITMLGPIAFDICGPSGASQAIGFLLGLCSIPLTVGPPIAGLLRDKLGSYTVAFLAAGCPPIVGAFVMCCIYRVSAQQQLNSNVSQEDDNVEVGERLLLDDNNRLRTTVTTTTIVSTYGEEGNSLRD